MADTFKREQTPSTFNWEFSPKGQHIELGIAEMNLFILLSALGLSHTINGERLLPIGTLYDPFIARGLDALNYACYQDARFIVVATPSGITLAGEGGAHESIAEPLIGLAQDGLASFEPAYVDELAVVMRWAFTYMQKDGDAAPSEQNWLRDETGGSVYLRLSTRPIEQIKRQMTPELRQQVVDGAYWLRKPGPNCPVVVAYTGAVAAEAIEAVGLIAEDRRDVGLLAVSSADRLNAGWTAAQRARERGLAMHARISSGCSPTCRRIAASSACSTDIRRHWPGSARRRPSAGRSASSISARPAHWPIFTATTESTPMRSRGGASDRARPPDPTPQGAALSRHYIIVPIPNSMTGIARITTQTMIAQTITAIV